MLFTTRRWIICSLISSPELKQASKSSKRTILEAIKNKQQTKRYKTSFDLFFNWIPSIICVDSLVWTVGMKGAILSSKQGVPQALSQWSWLFTSFSDTFLQGFLHVRSLFIIQWFRRRYRKYCSYSDISYSPLSGQNWLTSPRKPQSLLHLSSFPTV